MTNVGQIDVKLGLNSDEFIKAWAQADDKIKKLEKSLESSKQDFENVATAMAGTNKPSKEMVALFEQVKQKLKDDTKALEEFQNKLNRTKGEFAETSPAVNMLSGALKKLAGPAIAVAVGKKLLDMGKAAVDTAAKFETLAVSFEVLTGGAEAGKRLTDEIIELAAKTPLTTEALSDGARTLLSFGESADEVINDLRLLGDITGGDAQRMQSLTLAFAQVGSTGRLAGQDLLQMINAGFNPLAIMSEKTGKSMAKLKDEMSKGLITFNDVKNAMIDATSEGGRFYGMMNKQSETLEGRLSTLSDTWGLVAKSIGEVFLPAAKKAVEAMTAIGESIYKTNEWLKSEKSTLKGLKESWDKYWASKRKSKDTLTFTFEPYLDKKRTEQTKKEVEQVKKGFAELSTTGTPSTKTPKTKDPAVEAAKKQKQDLLNISKAYQRELWNIESLETAKSDLGGFVGSFQASYSQKLGVLQWYYNERKRIADIANNDFALAQEQFAQLDALKNQKLAQINLDAWTQYGYRLKSVIGGSLNEVLTGQENFGDAMISLMQNIYKELIRMAIEKALEEIAIEQWLQTTLAAIKMAFGVLTGGIGGAAVGAITSATPAIASLDTFHSGGLSTKEQLAVIRKDERVLSPAETTSYNSGQGGTSEGGANNIIMFNIKAWDGKDVINTLKSNSQTINQIVASGIKNNNQGLRTTVQNI